MNINNNIDIIIDSLIPRGGEKPSCICVSLEDYLSRLSNFNRKIQGTRYRMECWSSICEEHKVKFDEMANVKASDLLIKNNPRTTFFTYSLRDSKLENEFEMFLYSIISTLSALTRVVACFLEGSIQIHSHSKLAAVLLKHPDFNKSQSIVADACNTWAKELTDRRDAATHYITLHYLLLRLWCNQKLIMLLSIKTSSE